MAINHVLTSGVHNFQGSFNNLESVSIGETSSIPTLVSGEGTGKFENLTGELRGSGKIIANYFYNNVGSLSPGFTSTGIMNFDADEEFSNCNINLEIFGTKTPGIDFDQIIVNGTAMLGGTLNVTISYNSKIGDEVIIVNATALSGNFSSTKGIPFGWEIKYNYPSVGKVTLVNKVTSTIGLSENINELLIYPNPAKDNIEIQLHGVINNSTLMIFNELGEVVMQKEIKENYTSNSSVDVKSLVAGLYMVRLVDTNNKVFMGKLIVIK